MQKIIYTNHALKRLQQRGIPFDAVEILKEFGESKRSNNDTKKFFFNKKSLKKIRYKKKIYEKYRRFDKQIKSTAVVLKNVQDGYLCITAMKVSNKI